MTKQKNRRYSLPALLVNASLADDDKLDTSFELQNAKLTQTKKQMLREDVFLSDHTVAIDDPRIIEPLEAMTRIRRRTGFDPSLMKDKGWAAKVSKDLALGLAKVDEIDAEKRKREVGCNRSMDFEKMMLRRRMENLKNKCSCSTKRNHVRSLSENDGITKAYTKLYKSVGDLTLYITQLEEQGGFISPKSHCFKYQTIASKHENIPDKKIDDNEVIWQLNKVIKLPGIVKRSDCNKETMSSHIDDSVDTEPEPIKSVNSEHNEKVQTSMNFRSPSLPSIQSFPKLIQQDLIKRSSVSLHNNLNLMAKNT